MQHAAFKKKVCFFNSRTLDVWPNNWLKYCLTEEVIRGKQIQDVLTERRSFQDSCSSFSLCHSRLHTHTRMQTHTPLPLSFLASDSRHPAMTWGVSLAASKAALNRQKYLLWQTDRPSPTTTCMQLSLSLLLLFPTLWFDFPLCSSLSTLQQHFPYFFFFPSHTILKSYTYIYDIVFGSVWLMARNEGVDRGREEGGSAFMRPTVEHTAFLHLISVGLHRSSSLLLSFAQSFVLTFFHVHLRIRSPSLRLFSSLFLRHSRSQLGGSGSGIWSWKDPKISSNKKPLL